MSQLVLTEQVGAVAIVTLNRPERHNSLVPAFLGEILAALEGIGAEPGLRAVVLKANGRSFSTGGDVGGFDAHRDDLVAYARTLVGLLNQVILALVDLPQPVVAAVHGIVTGGALGLVLGSDVVLVAPEVSFAPYYCVVGFGPDGGWTAILPDVIGPRRAAEVLLRNLTIDAEQAVAWGLANQIVPADEIHDEALRIAQEIAAKKPGSVRHTKRLLGLARGNLAARLEAERAHFVAQIETDEARQGIAAFLGERRR